MIFVRRGERGRLVQFKKEKEELKFFPNINQSKSYIEYKKVDERNNQSDLEARKENLLKKENAIVNSTTNKITIDPEKQVEEDVLLLYGKDLTASAQQGLLDPVVGRENEINNLMRVLSRRSKNNPILIGNPGVGKTSIAKLLAQLIAGDLKKNSMGSVSVLQE